MAIGVKKPHRIVGDFYWIPNLSPTQTIYADHTDYQFWFQPDNMGEAEINPVSLLTFSRFASVYQNVVDSNFPVNFASHVVDNIPPDYPNIVYETYLAWAVADSNENFYGFVITKRPRCLASSFVGGGVRGTGNNFFTVDAGIQNSPFQFTNTATVLIRDGSGNYNQGFIQSLTSTTIEVYLHGFGQMGKDLDPLATDFEIIQMNNFKPYVVNVISQAVYQPNYQLIGEIYSLPVPFGIQHIYRVDAPKRLAPPSSLAAFGTLRLVLDFNHVNGVATNEPIHWQTYAPYWADEITYHIRVEPSAAPTGFSEGFITGNGAIFPFDTNFPSGTVGWHRTTVPTTNHNPALLTIAATAPSANIKIYVAEYSVNGGMKC